MNQILCLITCLGLAANLAGAETKPPMGVCPPFQLKDDAGNVIDPARGLNATVPYSPKQTCGTSGCHDYNKITEGFHFQQGKGEAVPAQMAERYRWVSSPGNYGGTWCSPAPLYRQLAAKTNASARVIDMASFEFVTATCGNCHLGGGPPTSSKPATGISSTITNWPRGQGSWRSSATAGRCAGRTWIGSGN
jgi:hypothetical protein